MTEMITVTAKELKDLPPGTYRIEYAEAWVAQQEVDREVPRKPGRAR